MLRNLVKVTITTGMLWVLIESGYVFLKMDKGITENKGELVQIPEEFIIYRDYISAIGGIPRVADTGAIEATVISITKTEICPYQEEKCRIDPYPKDLGIVRIDKIVNYVRYSEQSAEQPVEQPSKESSNETKTPAYQGSEYLSRRKLKYKPLQENQEVPVLFVLTLRPARVRYVPIPESESGLESMQSAEDISQQTVEHEIQSTKRIFKPIPKKGKYLVFTTEVGRFPDVIEKTLPGLEEGDKFHAEVYYDGSLLYVKEYEVIS